MKKVPAKLKGKASKETSKEKLKEKRVNNKEATNVITAGIRILFIFLL